MAQKSNINPALAQQKLEEVKFKQTGGGWCSNIGKGIGGAFTGGVPEKEIKNYQTCLTYMKSFNGKRVIMTGATGGIGSKVAKKLIKAGKDLIFVISFV